MKKENKILNEEIHLKQLENGLKIYVVPKKGFREKIGMIGTHFGSVYNKYKSNDIKTIPFGTAHFLEHKMFDEPKLDIIDEFAKLEAETNAYTNYINTSYFFNGSKNFEQCFKLLIDFVTNPHFIAEKVESEKGIISQEIKMYEDYPTWKVFYNMMKKLYYNKSFTTSISGDVDDINTVDEKILLSTYNDFYVPNNMYVICVGELEPEKVFEMTEKFYNIKNKQVPEIILEKETKTVLENYIEEKMHISNNIFCLGFKNLDDKTDLKIKTVASKLIIDIIFGESSKFYDKMYTSGLIDNSFNGDYNDFKFFGNTVLAGTSKDPKQLKDNILEELRNVKQKGISEQRFEQIKKKHLGRFMREFNDIENISSVLEDCVSRGYDFIDMMETIEHINIDDLSNFLKNNFNENNYVLSVVKSKS